MEKRNFFQEAKENSEKEFLNAGGDFNASDLMGDKYTNAEAAAPAMRTSSPYIFTITNKATTDVEGVNVLNAGVRFTDGLAEKDDGTTYSASEVAVTYNIKNVNYKQFLTWLLASNTMIGKVYITSDKATNLTNNFSLEVYNVTGGSSSKEYTPVIDPYQQQNNTLVWDVRFVINSLTKFRVDRLSGNSYIKFMFYPMVENIKAATKEFETPVIGSPAIRVK